MYLQSGAEGDKVHSLLFDLALMSERTLEVMTPLQTSQALVAPADILHIPSSPQTHPPPSYLQKHGVSKRANALFPSHLKYMTHKSPGEYLSLLESVWNTSICLPYPWGPVLWLCVYWENIALQLPVSIPGFSDAHQSLCKICGVRLLPYPDIAVILMRYTLHNSIACFLKKKFKCGFYQDNYFAWEDDFFSWDM